MRALKAMVFILCTCLVFGVVPTADAVEDPNPKPLTEVFDQMVIVPFPNQGNAFINGEKASFNHEMVVHKGRFMVPIRSMSYLVTHADQDQGTWEAHWEPKHPDEVRINNYALHKTVKLTVNSKTVIVNKEARELEMAPIKKQGQILLPLKDAAEVFGLNIYWWNGLLLLGVPEVDLQAPETLAIRDQIKKELNDPRKPMDGGYSLSLLTRYGDTSYYFKFFYDQNKGGEALYKKTNGQKEVRVPLKGNPVLMYAKVINGELYYVSAGNQTSELYAFRFSDQTNRKICNLDKAPYSGRWMTDIRYMDNELYLVFGNGELIMGHETMYKVVQGGLKEVASAKDFITFLKAGEYIYYLDFNPMIDASDNLIRLNTKTGKTESIGEEGFGYGILRKPNDGGGITYSGTDSQYRFNDDFYALGYKASDPEAESAVYRIQSSDRTHVKLTPPADQFWIIDTRIYYIHAQTGYLESVDINGQNISTEVSRKVKNVRFYNGSVYYMVNENAASSQLGTLYQYRIEEKREIKLSVPFVKTFYVGSAGVYYVTSGYEPGLFKINAKGESITLVKDSISAALLTDEGLIYTLSYKDGVFSVK